MGYFNWHRARYCYVGISLILITILIELIYTHSHILNWSTFGLSLIFLIKEIGIALFIVGSITIALELTNFTEYFMTRVTDVMIKGAFIDRLSDEQKKELKSKLEEKLYFKDQIQDKGSFFLRLKTVLFHC